jgi:hypothetical protein
LTHQVSFSQFNQTAMAGRSLLQQAAQVLLREQQQQHSQVFLRQLSCLASG